MESDRAARRLAESFPEARIVFLLRDPIERAISHYWFSVENGVETLGMDEAFERENGENEERWHRLSMSPFSYLRRGCYVDDIARYEALFGGERLRILLYEELVRDRRVFRGLCAWLGVSGDVAPEAPPRDPNLRDTHDTVLSPDLQKKLRDRFAQPTEALARRYGVDVTGWIRAWGT
jgi:hypothetical protein